MLAAQQCILRGQAITHQWRAVVDAVNIMETLRRAGHIQDPGGHIYAAVEAILRAIERKKAIERRAKYLREWLMYGMSIAQIQKIECPQFRISIANNPESVDIYEPDLIPAEYMRQPEPPPPEPDKAAIKEALRAGVEIQGARLVRGKRLNIK